MPSRTKGPRLPFGLHELIAPGGIPYETIFIGEDEDFGFVLAKCFEYGSQRGKRIPVDLNRIVTETLELVRGWIARTEFPAA